MKYERFKNEVGSSTNDNVIKRLIYFKLYYELKGHSFGKKNFDIFDTMRTDPKYFVRGKKILLQIVFFLQFGFGL